MCDIGALPRRAIFVGAIFLSGLSACKATNTPEPAESADLTGTAQGDITGSWSGTFTSFRGNEYLISFNLDATDGNISGTGTFPSDTKATVTGTVKGNRVTWLTSNGFEYNMTLNASGNRLTGDVSGPRPGTVTLSR